MCEEKKPKVSVCVVTFNQKDYIRQCLQSIIEQKTNFDFEIIVSDDCSTDETRAIVEEFSDKYPNIVKPIYHEKNIGAYKNFLFAHQAAKGKYIAHVDGDDYCLPDKLQVQTDFLDLHQECNVLFHRMKILYENKKELLDDLTDVAIIPIGGYTRSAVLRHISIGAHSSKMYRACNQIKEYPQFEIVDYFATVEQVGTGKACFVNNHPYGVYRAQIGVASQGNTTRFALCNSFLYFAKKYPEDRKNINAAALLLFLADIKNKRPTWRNFFVVYIKTFHLMTPINLLRNWHITKMLRLPEYKE